MACRRARGKFSFSDGRTNDVRLPELRRYVGPVARELDLALLALTVPGEVLHSTPLGPVPDHPEPEVSMVRRCGQERLDQ